MTYSQTTKTLKVQTLLTPMGEIERPRPMTQYFSYLVTMRSRDQELLTCRAWSSDFNVGIGGLPLPARTIISVTTNGHLLRNGGVSHSSR
jgi:hypothetical protein